MHGRLRLGCRLAGLISVIVLLAPLQAARASLPASLPAEFDAAATLVVSPSGNDATGNGSLQAPYRTPTKALAVAAPGTTVALDAGAYDRLRDTRQRAGTVRVRPLGDDAPVVAGADLLGAEGVDISGIDFRASVVVSNHPVVKTQQPARRITITESRMTTGVTDRVVTTDACLTIRAGSSDVTVEQNEIYGCTTGITGTVKDQPSRNVLIKDNHLHHFTMDAIQFGSWYGAVFDGNDIHDMADPAAYAHTDGIQFVGDARDIVIKNNRIQRSQFGQLILVQDQHGAISHVTIENNLLVGTSGWALQVQGALNTRVVNNTIWGNGIGGVIVRPGPGTGTVPHDTIVANNVIDVLNWYQGATPGYQGHNVLGKKPSILGPGDVVTLDPGFDEHFFPIEGSLLLGLADASFAPSTDIDGRQRPAAPTAGALELRTAERPLEPVPGPQTPEDPSPNAPEVVDPPLGSDVPESPGADPAPSAEVPGSEAPPAAAPSVDRSPNLPAQAPLARPSVPTGEFGPVAAPVSPAPRAAAGTTAVRAPHVRPPVRTLAATGAKRDPSAGLPRSPARGGRVSAAPPARAWRPGRTLRGRVPAFVARIAARTLSIRCSAACVVRIGTGRAVRKKTLRAGQRIRLRLGRVPTTMSLTVSERFGMRRTARYVRRAQLSSHRG
jgi:hypothetical protein